MKPQLKGNLPLLSSQNRLWIMSQQDNNNPAYNLQLTYHFNGAIDCSILTKSLGVLFERHYTMFSLFRQESGTPYIDIVSREVKVESVDFTDLPVELRKERIFSFAIEDSRKSFDIERGPLYRLYILKEDNLSYYFHATIHHIVFDGWSRRIFVEELSLIYNDLLSGRNVELEPLIFQSFDYVEKENNLLDTRQENELVEFWKDNLKDCPAELKLPCDFPRKVDSSGLGCRESFEITKECTSGLKEIGNKEGTSLFNVALSLLGVLFEKYSGESDICIGIPVSNRRNYPLSDKIFGLFINTSVVRLKVDSKSSFQDQVRYSKDVVRNAILHSKLPFEKIVESVKPERIPGINPLFQVSLSWLTDLTIPMNFGSIQGTRTTLPGGISPFDITFYMWEEKDVLKGDIEYSIDIFHPSTILRLKDSLIHLAQSVVDCHDKNLSEISAISGTEKQKIDGFNDTGLSIPDCLIHDFFEEQAIIQPFKTAVISGKESLTYKELDDLANQLARHLLSRGMRSGDTVGICLERSAEMLVSVLGVLKMGGCYLPMDPSFPDDRLSYMFEDSGAGMLISENSLKDRLLQLPDTLTILIDTDKEEIIRNSTNKPELSITNQSPAYIIYTSGSTGKPKGVKVNHKSVVNLVESMSIKPGIKSNDILLAVVTLSFDMSVYELFVTLSKGATVVIAGSEDITDGFGLIELIEKNNITIIQGTPSFWSILLSAGWFGKKDLKALCGGEALTYSLVRQILPKVGEFWNCYGPTETTVYATCSQITDENAPIVIGKPIHNTTIHILNKDNNLLPVGVIGEVAIGGICLAKGYHNRPDLTKEKFIRIENSEVVYKTGDLGRYNNDGNVELFGRADNQIKIRGFRVEPGEIETLLAKFKGVRESVVALHRFDDNDERLVAFLNVEADFKLSDEEIKTSLSQSLPGYMIPSFFQHSDGFPRLPNGKINKKALLFDLQGSGKKQVLDIDSMTPTQKRVITIWESVLKTQAINLTDSFFDAGGNSLLGIRFINKIREELDVKVTFRELLMNFTIGQLCSLIDNQKSVSEETIELVHLTEMRNLPLTRNQKRLWLLSKLHPDLPWYIIRSTFRFKGSLNREIFQRSLEKLFHRHYILFSRIREKSGDPYCDIVLTEVAVSFIDLTSLPEEERKAKVNNIFHEDSKKGFDLENGPLYRMYLIKTAEDEHFFYISIHHVIFDGWSQGVFANDLSEIYNSLLRGKDADLEALEFQQYDYAFWESGRKESSESVEFWKENLTGCSPVLNFPYDSPRSEQTTGRGGLVMVTIPRELSDDLRRISKEADTSLFTTMMSVFGVLLKKYSGEDDFNIGLPVAYRPHTGLEKIFGMFVNTVVVRMRYEEEITFRQLLKKTDNAAMDAISHQDLPFENVVEIIKPERVSGANPLFQVAFVWQNNLYVPVNLDGVSSEVIKSDQRTATFDLSIAMWENGDTIEGEIEYNMDIIKPETINRFKEHFLILVRNLTANINLPVNSVPLISDKELKMISEINNTAADYPRDKTMVELFEGIVTLFPDKIAISFKGKSHTYRQLNEKSNQLARILRESGVGKNTPVGLFTDKSLEMIVGMLAILKAGGCYTPIDPEYPLQRINFIVKDSGIKTVLVQGKYMGIEIEEVQKLNLDTQYPNNSDKSNLQRINGPEDLAHIIYTSGTTGTPKGTPILHRGVLRTLCNTNWINITPDDRVLQQAPIVFDMSTAEIWATLLHGGSLYIIDKETLLNPEALGEEMLKNEITVFIITPAVFTKLLESHPDIFKRLKYMAMGGDVLPFAQINKVRQVNPGLTVINGYGPTENTIVSAVYKIERDFDQSIPIGRPNSNSTAYIFDKYLNYQPIGVVGELYVGGDGLSPGYLNREDLNKKCFIENPHIPGERLYKTGDLVKWLPDWNIDFLGRADNQLKIRGFRIELEEIESVISELDGVIETVVKPVKVEQGDYRLVAFLNIRESFAIDKLDILAKIKAKLPVYMLPSSFKFMHEFPKTINGKTDRKALSIDISEMERRESVDITTLSPTERTIHKIWCDALKSDDVLVTDNFFDIGGNSLLVFRIINQIKKDFGITLTFKDFLSNSIINQLSVFIDGKAGGKEDSIVMVHMTETKNMPLTKNQKRLWFISQLQPNIPSYIIRLTYKFSGSLKYDLFEKSLDILFSRHHTIFSVIKELNGEPICEIVPHKVKISFIDYTDLSEIEKSEKISALLSEESKLKFDLVQGPLYRVYLIKSANDEYYFRLSIHHIIFDGWSQGVLVNDLGEIYNSLVTGTEINLEELEFQQYDYAQWERDMTESAESIAFWEDYLKGCSPMLDFPFDFPRRENMTGKGGLEEIRFSRDLSDSLRRISREEGTSLFTTIMSGFGLLMNRYSGEPDLNIGLPVAFRPHAKLEKIFGMFVNTIVVRLKYEKGVTFRELIKQSDDAAINAISHQDLPFERVVEIVKPDRISGANPLFQFAFAWQNNLNVPIKLEGIKSELIKGKERAATFDLTLVLWENGDIIEGEIEYNMDILQLETINRLKDNLLTLLNNLTVDINVPVNSVPMISEKDIRIIDEINNTATIYPKDKTIAQLFEEKVNMFSDNIAISFQGKSYTYRQLNEKANKLARTIRESGVMPNTPVGILSDKSLEMIIGILGILKAGGCYTPIDPEYPEQRIDFIIKDSGVKVLLTQSKYMGVPIEGVQKLNLNSEELYNSDGANLKCVSQPEDFAYILYTSGTTGIPKGTPVPQRGVIRLVCNTNYTEFTSEDRVILVGAYVFDATTLEIWSALLNGGSLYIIDKETLLDPEALEKEMMINGITHLIITPALFHHFVDNRINVFSKLKSLIIGGDVLSPDHSNRVRKFNPDLVLINGYGPTENTTMSTFFKVDRDFTHKIPIGKPNSNSTVYIFDKDLNYQPIGVPGELYVGGDGLSAGYLNREELNRVNFIEHPFKPGERIYKTGDLVRWLPDWNIDFFGRADNQLKIRGFRIELEEIEAVISELDGVIETVVKAVKVEQGDYRLVAFLNVPETFKSETQEILAKLRTKLPVYMIPSAFKIMHGFPMTINGKIDKKALSLPDFSDVDLAQFVAPSTEIERALAKIWSLVLRIPEEKISVKADFFDLGGDSIKSIQVVSRMRSAGYELKISEVLSSSGLEAMASKAKELSRIIDQEVVSGEVLLNPIQQAFFRNDLVAGDAKEMNHFNQSFLLHFKEGISMEEVEVIFRKIVEHHDALRIVYRKDDSLWNQNNQGLDGSFFELQKYDLKNKKDGFTQLEYLSGNLKSSIDIEQGPLLKLGLFQMDDGDKLLITIHHLVIDLVSWRILFDDISTLLHQYKTGKELTLPAKTDSFQYWMIKNAAFAEGFALKQELVYWQLQERKKVDILTVNHEEGRNLFVDLVSSGFTLKRDETTFVQACLNGKNKVEINTLLLAALGQSLQRVFGMHSIKMNLEGHGREEFIDDVDISRTVGWFTCMYPVILELPVTGIVDMVGLLSLDESLNLVPNKGVGYGLIKYLSKFKLEYSQTKAQINFNYLGEFDRNHGSDDSSAYTLSELSHGSDVALQLQRDTELDVTGQTIDGLLRMSIRYSRQRYDKETIDVLTDLYKTELLSLAELLSKNKTRITVPGDFTYKGLSIGQITELEQEYGKIEEIYGLSPMQKGLYFLALSNPQSSAYFVQLGYRVSGRLDLMKIQECYSELVNRHAVLRTVFRNDLSTDLLQIVRAESKPDFRFIDISTKSKEEQVEFLKEFRLKDRSVGFDLTKGPLIRLIILRLSEEKHELVWSNHHLIMDGWSMSVLLAEFDRLYESKVRGMDFKLSVTKPFSDYIAWLSKFDEETCKHYWRDYLKGYDSLSSIPADKVKKNKDSFGVINHDFYLSEQISKQLQLTAVKYKCTLNTVMQSVWGILLGRYNNTNDVVFGSVVSGRPSVLKGVQEIVGLFINTVPQRIKFQPETRFGDLLLNVQQSFITGEPYHHMNLAEVQSLSEIGSGLLDHLMVFENYPRSEKPLGNKENIEGLLEFEVGSIDAFEQVNYDFSVMILPGKELLVKFKYNGESYSEPFIGRLESQFKLILNNLVENPDMLIREIPLLSEDDKKKIEVFNNTDSPYEQSLCIHHKFELQANINPELPALITKERTLSYKDLNEHANRMANYLISKELKVEDIVGICIDRSIEMMIGIFGILKTGAAYLPLSPENPTDRLRSIINDAKPKLILSGKESAMNIPEESTVVYIDNILQEPLSANSSNPEVEMSSKNLAYVLYTSGSTGTPKGVMIEHHSVLNRLGWMQKAYPIGATDTLIQKTPITFDVSVWELFWWSFNGSKLVLLPKGGERDPETMIDYIDYFKVTTMHFVPSMFATFFETIVTRKLLDKLECMNRIFLSGEALPSTLVRDFNVMRKEFSLPDLINLYGPTEATVDVSYYNCPKENIENIYIGKPIDNTKLFVVNKLNEIQPIGISGELLITGVNLARGYMNRPDLTAEKFFDFRLSDGKSIKAYHTGDLVKLTSEGELDYLGRMDNQIKIRGFRIELGDIEAQISEHPMVSNVAVIMSENGQNKLLLAYVCLKPGCELEADKLRKYLNGKLPEYMVPSFIIFLDILPLTSSGKLDRKSLPAPDRIIERNELATPSNKNEKILLDLWKDILKIENLSINDNFFDVGGNSLSAISLANLISKEFNITLKVLMVFEFPNIKSQSEYLSGEKGKKYSLTNDDIDEKSKSKRKIDYKRFKR